ncbi:MAG: hypothetical protein AAGC63_14075, partial [Propionicimonas sp.]
MKVGDLAQTYHLLVGYLSPGSAEPGAVVARADLPGIGMVDVVDAPASPTAMGAFLDVIAGPAPGMRWLAGTGRV